MYIGDKGKKTNDLILDYLRSDKKFALSRIGLSEVRWVDWFIRGGLDFNCDGSLFSGSTYTPTLKHRLEYGGVYGDCGDEFFSEYNKGISTADLQVFWFNYDGSKLVYNEQINIFNNFSKDSLKVDCEVLAPYIHTDFWSKGLEGKKVLVIYPFVDTIRSQYEKRDLIWSGNHSKKLPKFELKTYKPVWSVNGAKPHGSWKESLDVMKNDISEIDFDVALLGCSHYGLPLVSHIKDVMNKSAIYMGGELQILFGIKGGRWDRWERVSSLYNEHWTRSTEIPSEVNAQNSLDGGCYW